MQTSSSSSVFWRTAAAAAALDLGSKWLAVRYLPLFDLPTPRAGDAVRLAVAYNPEGPFRLLGPGTASPWVFTALCMVTLLGVAWLRGRTAPAGAGWTTALALVAGGTAANLLNRWAEPRGVVDFIAVSIGGNRSAIFNPADLFIAGGVLAMVALAVRGRRTLALALG